MGLVAVDGKVAADERGTIGGGISGRGRRPSGRTNGDGAARGGGGLAEEGLACAALERDGFTILGRRMRTAAGEIDAVAERDGLTVFVEVKARRTLAIAAAALRPRQQARIAGAAEILLAEHGDWGASGVRFDLIAMDRAGQMRRVQDVIRLI